VPDLVIVKKEVVGNNLEENKENLAPDQFDDHNIRYNLSFYY